MILAELITAAAGGLATLTRADGANAAVILPGAVALAAAVEEDRKALGLGLLPELGRCTVALEQLGGGGPVVLVGGVLRYAVDSDRVARLCTVRGCTGESLGRRLATRVCAEHLDIVPPGMLPAADDDIRPGDRETAARESRELRLSTWAEEIEETERTTAGDRRMVGRLRGEPFAVPLTRSE